jgi:hypothetical protein
MSRNSTHQREDERLERLSADVAAAAGALGWVPPTDVRDVARLEEELAAAPVRLPEELRAAPEVRSGGAADRPWRAEASGLPVSADADAAMARAAREGGPVPPEVEEAMRRDRRAAEEEFDRTHGEDAGQ